MAPAKSPLSPATTFCTDAGAARSASSARATTLADFVMRIFLMPCRLRQRFRVDFSRGASLVRLERRRKFATAPISLHGENLITRFRLSHPLAARANARAATRPCRRRGRLRNSRLPPGGSLSPCPLISPSQRCTAPISAVGQIRPWRSISEDGSLPSIASVPVGCRLRKERAKSCLPHYPELMIRMLLVGSCYGIRHERQLCQEVALHLAYRWFCKLDLDDKVPHHSTFSVNRLGRFRESEILRHIFERVVAGCMAAGLVKGEGFAVDASVMEANASRYHGKAPDELEWSDAQRQKRAVAQYLAGLEAQAPVQED